MVVNEWPREGLLEGIKETACELCRRKPGTTYDNWVGQYEEKYLSGEGIVWRRRRSLISLKLHLSDI